MNTDFNIWEKGVYFKEKYNAFIILLSHISEFLSFNSFLLKTDSFTYFY